MKVWLIATSIGCNQQLVCGDGRSVERQIIPATRHGAFGTYRFEIPFESAGKKWVRFAVWDSAGNGAFTHPVHLKNAELYR